MAGRFRQLWRVTLDVSHSILVIARTPIEATNKACTNPDYKSFNIIQVEKYGELWEPSEVRSE